MITKPSLNDLLEGIAVTAERVVQPLLQDSRADPVTPILMLVDRIEAEWPLAACYLVEDNLDLELTLGRLEPLAGRAWPRQLRPEMPDGERERRFAVPELAERNRRLKASVVAAMDALDLPALPGDPAERHAADEEVRLLLRRVLQREHEAMPPTPPRINPLSRGGDALTAAQAVEMSATLERFLAAQMPEASAIAVSELARMAGGASREAFVFRARWTAPDGDREEGCVLLRQPVSSVLESDDSEDKMTGSRRLPHIEFKMVRCMEDQGIPTPHMLWVDPTGTWLERPFSVARWIDGEADLAKLPEAANLATILDQYVEILGRVHNLDPAAAGVDFLGTPTAETAALEQVELFAQGYDRQRLEDYPGIAYLIRWLRKHAPTAGKVSVVHGDFRLGNFMWDDDGIVAMLDWEQCHLGDALEEIAFMYWPLWSLKAFVPIQELVRRYEAASGIKVDDATLAYYRHFIELKMAVVILTGVKSFFATEERQLFYGASTAFQMLRDCQARVLDDLMAGGPTVEFGDDQR